MKGELSDEGSVHRWLVSSRCHVESHMPGKRFLFSSPTCSILWKMELVRAFPKSMMYETLVKKSDGKVG